MTSQSTIFRIITPEDIAADSKAASGPGLLFVECNGQDGRIESRVRPLVNRHVMLNHAYQGAPQAYESTKRLSGVAAVAKQASHHARTPSPPPAQSRNFSFVPTSRQVRKRKPRKKSQTKTSNALSRKAAAAHNKTPNLVPLSSPTRAIENVYRWWFDARSDLRPTFDVAKSHWVESAWNMARRSDAVYECVALYAARKKAMITGSWSEYVTQEVRCIRSMSDEVQKPTVGPRPLLPVAIGVLAYLALLDRRVDIAVTHLLAIKSLWGPASFEDTRQEWVYVVWLDLRFAMHLGRAPILKYFISAPFRELALPKMPFDLDQVSSEKAERCAELCPRSDIFDTSTATSLFKGIFELYLAWPALATAEQTPFGRIYDLDYRLCTLRSKVLPVSKEGETSVEVGVELVLTVMQIHVWVVTRFWAPVGTASRDALLTRACRLLASCPTSDFIATWKARADLASLLWILSTITACAVELGLKSLIVPADALRLTAKSLGVRDFQTFSESMMVWPWLDNWHRVKYDKLWNLVDPDHTSDLGTAITGLHNPKRPTILGGLEFYDE